MKNFSLIVAGVIILLLLITLYFTKRESDLNKLNYNLKNNEFVSKIDSLGKETVKLNGTLLSEKTLKETKIKELEKFEKELNNMKQLVAYYKINTGISDTIFTVLNKIDTIFTNNDQIDSVRTFIYDDQWTRISGYLRSNDSVTIAYNIESGAEILHTWKRPGFLKRKVAEITVKFNNPNIRTKEIKTIIKKPKKRFFLFRLLGI